MPQLGDGTRLISRVSLYMMVMAGCARTAQSQQLCTPKHRGATLVTGSPRCRPHAPPLPFLGAGPIASGAPSSSATPTVHAINTHRPGQPVTHAPLRHACPPNPFAQPALAGPARPEAHLVSCTHEPKTPHARPRRIPPLRASTCIVPSACQCTPGPALGPLVLAAPKVRALCTGRAAPRHAQSCQPGPCACSSCTLRSDAWTRIVVPLSFCAHAPHSHAVHAEVWNACPTWTVDKLSRLCQSQPKAPFAFA